HRRRAALGHTNLGHHCHRGTAEPDAIHRRVAGRLRVRGSVGLGGSGGARPGVVRLTDDWHDPVLGHLLRSDHQLVVVVVAPANHHYHRAVHRAVFDGGWARRARQPAPATPRLMATELLRVEDLRVSYHTPTGPVRAVDGVSFDLMPQERLGLVGESGSGKSTIALALMRLIRQPGEIEGGNVYL